MGKKTLCGPFKAEKRKKNEKRANRTIIFIHKTLNLTNQALWGVGFTARKFVVMTRKVKWAAKYNFWFHSRYGDFYGLFL